MLCKREGFTAIKIATLVVLSAATATQIAALVNDWDRIDATIAPYNLKIRGHGNVFGLTVVEDVPTFFSRKEVRDKPEKSDWRKTVKLMETTAIGIGVLGAVFVVLSALLIKFTRGFWLHFLMRILGIISILCSSNEILLGAMLYKYQFHNVLSDIARNPRNKMPVDDYVVTTGWFIACGAAGTYLLAAILEIAEIAVGFSKSLKESTNVVEPFKDIKTDVHVPVTNNGKTADEKSKVSNKYPSKAINSQFTVKEKDESPNKKAKDVIPHPNMVATTDTKDSKEKKDLKDKNKIGN